MLEADSHGMHLCPRLKSREKLLKKIRLKLFTHRGFLERLLLPALPRVLQHPDIRPQPPDPLAS